MPNEVEHPGKHFCRFIGFNANNQAGRSYLEFVNVKKGGSPILDAGFSFGYTKHLEGFYKRLKSGQKLKVIFKHKNYQWKENKVDRLPGWNFVSFKNLGFRGFYPWITEYEPNGKKRKPMPKHPNGVTNIHGFKFRINERGEAFFSNLIKKPVKAKMKLPCGTFLYFDRAKSNSLELVILKSANLIKLTKKYPVDEMVEFDGKAAALISNPSDMWDIVIL